MITEYITNSIIKHRNVMHTSFDEIRHTTYDIRHMYPSLWGIDDITFKKNKMYSGWRGLPRETNTLLDLRHLLIIAVRFPFVFLTPFSGGSLKGSKIFTGEHFNCF